MPKPALKSRFPVSLFATPTLACQKMFYTAPRAGHLQAGPEHHIFREHFPGHELIYCLGGRGFVKVQGRMHEVGAGEMVWVNCQRPHEYGAHPTEPWEVYWVRIEGPGVMPMSENLGVAGAPIFAGLEPVQMDAIYRQVFHCLQSDRPEAPARLHALLAQLLARVFEVRQTRGREEALQIPLALRKPIEYVKLFYFQPQRVNDLAAMAGMSPAHFSRLFRASFGTSPIDWVRRERINQAKRRLAESGDQIQQIAEQVGYSDRFFFSKDFKQLTGITPRQFRQREKGRGPDS